MRKRVYIAGPISKGDLLHNVNQATAAFVALAKAGLAPFCPHWSVYSKPATHDPLEVYPPRILCRGTVSGNDEMTHADWIGVDLPWVVAADAVLRLPGDSTGADMEVACAADHDVPVFYSVDDVVAWAAA
jgi:hypothetical protein